VASAVGDTSFPWHLAGNPYTGRRIARQSDGVKSKGRGLVSQAQFSRIALAGAGAFDEEFTVTEPIQESTSQLIERARSCLYLRHQHSLTDSHRAVALSVFGAPAIGAGAVLFSTNARVETYSQHVSWSGVALAGFVGLAAVAIIIGILCFAVRLADKAGRAKRRLEMLQWIETQARDGLLTDAETRAEILQLLR
jgi:hypothetical protein